MSFKDRLLSVETEFFSALVQGDAAISIFNQHWEALLDDLNLAIESLDTDTLTLAHTTASRIAALADTSIELYINYDNFTNQLVDQLGSMMSELVISQDPSPDSHRSAPKELPPPRVVSEPCQQSRSRKRRRSTSPSDCKRRRVDASVVVNARRSCTETPGASVACSTFTTSTPPPSPSPNLSLLPICDASEVLAMDPDFVRTSRKRRLSSADASPPAQRTKIHMGPRLHAVSDSCVGCLSQGIATSTHITNPCASSLVDAPIVTEVPQEPLSLFPMASDMFGPASDLDFVNVTTYPATNPGEEERALTLGSLWRPYLDAAPSSSVSPLPNLFNSLWTPPCPAAPFPEPLLAPLSEETVAEGDDDLLPRSSTALSAATSFDGVPSTKHGSSGGWLPLLPDYSVLKDSTVDWDSVLELSTSDAWSSSCSTPCPALSYSESDDSEDECSPSTQPRDFIEVPTAHHPETRCLRQPRTKVVDGYELNSEQGVNDALYSSLTV